MPDGVASNEMVRMLTTFLGEWEYEEEETGVKLMGIEDVDGGACGLSDTKQATLRTRCAVGYRGKEILGN